MIYMTLAKIMDACNDWETVCDELGFDYYAVKDGGGDISVNLTFDQAQRFGIIDGHNVAETNITSMTVKEAASHYGESVEYRNQLHDLTNGIIDGELLSLMETNSVTQVKLTS
jgi:hypothetical protein